MKFEESFGIDSCSCTPQMIQHAEEIVPEAAPEVEAPATTVVTEGNQTLLFATKTCPNCKMAEKFLLEAGVDFQKVYAEDAPELTSKFGIKQAPTLVLLSDGSSMKIENVSNIRRFADSAKR